MTTLGCFSKTKAIFSGWSGYKNNQVLIASSLQTLYPSGRVKKMRNQDWARVNWQQIVHFFRPSVEHLCAPVARLTCHCIFISFALLKKHFQNESDVDINNGFRDVPYWTLNKHLWVDDINIEPNKLTKVSGDHLFAICFCEPTIPVYSQAMSLIKTWLASSHERLTVWCFGDFNKMCQGGQLILPRS